mgnify:CR=1 FL=1
MQKRRIGVVTFDLWDCVFCDETDEPKRASAGLPSKPEARRQVLHEALSQHGPIDRACVDIAFNVADQAFRKVWHEQFVTWTTRERIQVVLAGLNRNLPSLPRVPVASNAEAARMAAEDAESCAIAGEAAGAVHASCTFAAGIEAGNPSPAMLVDQHSAHLAV